MSEHTPTPWSYRPQKYDDWGYIRSPKEPNGFAPLAAIARGEASETHDSHRAAGTDPYGPNALLIVKAVNNHDVLVKSLTRARDAIRSVYHEIDNPAMPACLAAAWEVADLTLDAVGTPPASPEGK